MELLLNNFADPNDSADIGKEYLSMAEIEWSDNLIPDVIIFFKIILSTLASFSGILYLLKGT